MPARPPAVARRGRGTRRARSYPGWPSRPPGPAPGSSQRPAGSWTRGRPGERSPMQPALGLVEHRPAARPRILTRRGTPGARPAADRRVPLPQQRVDRNVVPGDIPVHVGLRPRRQWRDLHLAAAGVVPHDRRVGARRRLVAAKPGRPGVVPGQAALEWLDLAQVAALVRGTGVQPGTVLLVLLPYR